MTLEELLEEAKKYNPTPEQVAAFWERVRKSEEEIERKQRLITEEFLNKSITI